MSSDSSEARPTIVPSAVFKHACGQFATGVAIASAIDRLGTPHGLTVNSFSSVSLDPPLVLICLGHAVSVIEVFRAAPYFGLSVLAAGQRDLSDRFARKDYDRFDGLAWERGKTGVPLLPGTLAQMECVVVDRITQGDHDIFIGEMVEARVEEGEPLIYFGSRYRELG
jgi:flavin reductase (DIM6/NTAB) family NADH-FMN oxidoreductase RutF